MRSPEAGRPARSRCRGAACRRSCSGRARRGCWPTASKRSTRSRWSVAGKARRPSTSRGSRGRQSLRAAGRGGVDGPQPGGAAGGRPAGAGLPTMTGRSSAGRECVVEPTFRGPAGPDRDPDHPGVVRGEPGASSRRAGLLQVQRLAGSAGWHRLTLRFGPEETEISVDGQELAHGRGPGGPADRASGWRPGRPRRPPKAEGRRHFDDLRLIRFAEPPASLEVDPVRTRPGSSSATRSSARSRVPTPSAWSWPSTAGRSRCGGARSPGCTSAGCPRRARRSRGCWCGPSGGPAPGDRPTDVDFAEGRSVAQSDGVPHAGHARTPAR